LTEKGWGLGLTITKSLIDLHDGTLDIKSKVGKGTTVTVTLPNAEA
jgi:two-component system cell cycle sensor histidine kinase PleC